MRDAHEILVHAASITTFEAEQKYLRQSAACINFHAAIQHSLAGEEFNTPDGQIPPKIVTPSTTKSDRSDVVLDSQRKRGTKYESRGSTDAITDTAGMRLIDLSPDFNSRSIDHERMSSPKQAQLTRRASTSHDTISSYLVASDASYCLRVTDLANEPARRLANSNEGHMPGYAVATSLNSNDESTIYPTPTAFKDPEVKRHTVLSAREAVALRETLALERRRRSYRGLKQLHNVATTDRLNSVAPSVVPQVEDALETNMLCSTGLQAPLSFASDSRPSPIYCDRYITVTSDELHGPKRTPPSDGHTSVPSDRTARASVEHDLASSALKSDSHTPLTHSSSVTSTDLKRGCATKEQENAHEASTFVLAQLNSPFYNSAPLIALAGASQTAINCSSSGHANPTEVIVAMGSVRPCEIQSKHVDGTSLEDTHKHNVVHQSINPEELMLISASREEHTNKSPGNAQFSDLLLSRVGTPPSMRCRGLSSLIKPSGPVIPSSLIKSSFVAASPDTMSCMASANIAGPLQDTSVNLISPHRSQCKDYADCIPVQYACGSEVFGILNKQVNSESSTVSPFLAKMKIPWKMRYKLRDLRPLERGHWCVDLLKLRFSTQETRKLWHDLTRIVVTRNLIWVNLQFHANTLRVYCLGHDVLPVWTLIYAATKKVKKETCWKDAGGEIVIRM